jgi:transposase
VVDTEGLLMHAVVPPADVQERDGGILVLASLFGPYPFLKTLFADGGYQGPKFRAELAKLLPGLAVEIVKRSDTAQGFQVLPRRWVVERTFAWLNPSSRIRPRKIRIWSGCGMISIWNTTSISGLDG